MFVGDIQLCTTGFSVAVFMFKQSKDGLWCQDGGFKFTTAECVCLLALYIRCNTDYETIFTKFEEQFPNCRLPIRTNVQGQYRKFLATGLVADTLQVRCPITVTTPDNLETQALSYIEEANQSARRLSTTRHVSDRVLVFFLVVPISCRTYTAPCIKKCFK